MKQKKRPVGRPPGKVQDSILHMRVSAKFIEVVDDWRGQQPDAPSRTEAIRRLVEVGLDRPSTGVDPLIALRIPDEVIVEIDGWAKSKKLTRSAAIRKLLEAGAERLGLTAKAPKR